MKKDTPAAPDPIDDLFHDPEMGQGADVPDLLDDADETFEQEYVEPIFVIGEDVFRVDGFESEDAPPGKDWGYYKWHITAMNNAVEFTYITSKSPKAAWKMGDILRAFGIKGEGGRLKFSRREVEGKYFVAIGSKRADNNGRDQQDLDKFRPLTAEQEEYYNNLPPG